MKKLLFAGCAAVSLLAATPVWAQAVQQICVKNGTDQCFPVNAAFPLPVTNTGGGVATAVTGDSAAGAADNGSNPVKMGGVYSSTLPTFATGQRTQVQTDSHGQLLTYIAGGSVGVQGLTAEGAAVSGNPVRVSGWDGTLNRTIKTSTSGNIQADVNMNGTLVTASQPLAVVIAPSVTTSYGITPVAAGSAASGSVLKASAGSLYSAYATCTAQCWLMLFNSTTVPADGATTAGAASGNMQDCIPIPAGSAGAISYGSGPPEVFTVGISAAISSTGCATKTASTTAFIHGSIK